MGSNGLIERVKEAGFIGGVQAGMPAHALAGTAVHIQNRLEARRAFRKRADLVRTEHVHAAEVSN